MAFVPYYPGDPGYSSTGLVIYTGFAVPLVPGPYADNAVRGLEFVNPEEGALGATKSPLYNQQNLMINGFQVLEIDSGSGGGGGSTRPVSGMIYPRGTG